MANGGEMPTLEFHFDFGSPNAYLAHRVIPAIEQRLKEIAYAPHTLHHVIHTEVFHPYTLFHFFPCEGCGNGRPRLRPDGID